MLFPVPKNGDSDDDRYQYQLLDHANQAKKKTQSRTVNCSDRRIVVLPTFDLHTREDEHRSP